MDRTVDKNFLMDTEAIAKQIEMLIKGLAVLQRMITQDVPTFPSERLTLVEAGTCLNCGKPIGESRPVRGCHEYCYKQVSASIKQGEMTDFEAVEAGLFLPKEAGGSRKSTDTTLAKILAKKDEARLDKLDNRAGATQNDGGGKKRSRKPKGS